MRNESVPYYFYYFCGCQKGKEICNIYDKKKQILKEWAKYDFVFEYSNKYDQIQHDLIESVLVDFQSDSLEGMDDALIFFDGLLEKLLSQRSHGHYR